MMSDIGTVDRLEQRLTELETRVAFMDDLVASMNDIVALQDQRMLRVQTEVERLREDLGSVRNTLVADFGDEPPPPHY